jgi:hypothetical protein
MHVIGLAGVARSGKDTVANHLVKAHGYSKFSFSDALYREVSEAFGIKISWLHDPDLKEVPVSYLALENCSDGAFIVAARKTLWDLATDGYEKLPRSPRWILQTWGTEYRRAQNPNYWIDRASDWFCAEMREIMPEFYKLKVVNTSVRYPNEASWIRRLGGEVWHVRRADCPLIAKEGAGHSSEVPVPVGPEDTVIYNNGSINHLWTAITMRLGNRNLREIRVEGEE